MSWNFENAAPVIGTITEGNVWDGERMLYSNIAMSRILSYEPNSGLVETWCENTEGTNGLNYDSEGRLFGCSGNGRRIVRFDPNGEMVNIADRLGGRRINGPNDLAITPSGSIYFSDRVGDVNPDVGIDHSSIISAEPQAEGTYEMRRRRRRKTTRQGA